MFPTPPAVLEPILVLPFAAGAKLLRDAVA